LIGIAHQKQFTLDGTVLEPQRRLVKGMYIHGETQGLCQFD
jgi:hypothetical protein